MKGLFKLLVLFIVILTNSDALAILDTNVIKQSRIWVRNNSSVPLTLLVERTEIIIPDTSVNYFCWGACYPPQVSVSTDVVTILPGATDKYNFFGDYVIKSGTALSDTAQITYCFIDDCYYGNFQCFTATYSLNCPADSLYPMIAFDTSYCGATTDLNDEKIKVSIIVNNRMFDVIGREFYNYNEIPFGTLFIQNGKKYIRVTE